MTKNDLVKVVRASYRFGRENGEGRGEKNLNDFLASTIFKDAEKNLQIIIDNNKNLVEALSLLFEPGQDQVYIEVEKALGKRDSKKIQSAFKSVNQ